MKGVPYYEAGKGDTPRSCNSKKYLENYERIFGNARRQKKPDEKCPTASGFGNKCDKKSQCKHK